tara:strand:- start:621 stop:875 length:255 start_codon:yes stop_codon:yes gene_type:complete
MSRRLTFKDLKKIILEEKKKMQKAGIIPAEDVKTVEKAWAGGDNLVNKIDFVKKLGITETKLKQKAQKISKIRSALKKNIVKSL